MTSDNCVFNKCTPEEEGLSSRRIIDFLAEIDKYNINLHSLLMFRHNKIIFEGYWKPFNRNTLHRMFSVVKSFVSAGIGVLVGKGDIELDRPVIDYFPEYDCGEIDELVRQATVRDLLTMRSPHEKTAFKQILGNDYVKSFFSLKAKKVPGTAFSYDTSATHTLCALIEKITGNSLIDFLRKEFLADLGFSKDAYVLKDPLGRSLGGSGLMARPLDIGIFAHVFLNGGALWGKYSDRQVIPKDYAEAAVSKQVDTFVKGEIKEEKQGYGFKFWRISNNGYMCYGIGGQLAVILPDFDFVMVVTADTLEMKNGVERIFEIFWECVFPYFSKKSLPNDEKSFYRLNEISNSLCIKPLVFSDNEIMKENIADRIFNVEENEFGIKDLMVSIDNDNRGGKISFKSRKGKFELLFGFGRQVSGVFPFYKYKYIASGAFISANVLIIKCHIIDEEIGTVYFQFDITQNGGGVLLTKKNVGLGFDEFNRIYILKQ